MWYLCATTVEHRDAISKCYLLYNFLQLRKIEQRLGDADRHLPPPQLNQTGETSITDYGGLGRNIENTFEVPDGQAFASGVSASGVSYQMHI